MDFFLVLAIELVDWNSHTKVLVHPIMRDPL
jgi:hypothetical protein